MPKTWAWVVFSEIFSSGSSEGICGSRANGDFFLRFAFNSFSFVFENDVERLNCFEFRGKKSKLSCVSMNNDFGKWYYAETFNALLVCRRIFTILFKEKISPTAVHLYFNGKTVSKNWLKCLTIVFTNNGRVNNIEKEKKGDSYFECFTLWKISKCIM